MKKVARKSSSSSLLPKKGGSGLSMKGLPPFPQQERGKDESQRGLLKHEPAFPQEGAYEGYEGRQSSLGRHAKPL